MGLDSVHNTLIEMGYETVEDLEDLTEQQLLQILPGR
jgi:hypothetical protein